MILSLGILLSVLEFFFSFTEQGFCYLYHVLFGYCEKNRAWKKTQRVLFGFCEENTAN
jgi:hypothetical protein